MSFPGPIAHVIAPSPAGGAESVVAALAAATRDRSRGVILNQTIDRHEPPHPLVQQLTRLGVAADEIRCGRRQYRAEINALTRILEAQAIRLVHTHGYHGTWIGYHAARRIGIPIVATVHGYLTRSIKERLYNVIDRRLLRRFDAVIAVSEGIQRQLIGSGIDAGRVHFVQNGLGTGTGALTRVQARESMGVVATDRVVGWVGRLSPEKGPDLFLRALALAGNGHGVIVGDGPERERVEAMAGSLGLRAAGRVHFLGQRADAALLFQGFDVLALTSRMEGTPMVVLEAIAANVPLVSFRVGGIPGLLNDDMAWIVPPEDVKALGAALTAALDNPDQRRDRANRAREHVADRLSLDRWSDRVWDVYSIAASPGRR